MRNNLQSARVAKWWGAVVGEDVHSFILVYQFPEFDSMEIAGNVKKKSIA